MGKADNGQVAVFGALAKERFVSPFDARLFLPEKWARDSKRCEKAWIPKNILKFRTKIELALEIVENAHHNGLQYGWIGTDAEYGKGPGFCISLEKMHQIFVVDIHSDFFVYTDDPALYIPERKSRKGRSFKRY